MYFPQSFPTNALIHSAYYSNILPYNPSIFRLKVRQALLKNYVSGSIKNEIRLDTGALGVVVKNL